MTMTLFAVNDRGLNDAMQRRWFVRDDVSLSLMPELAAVVPIEALEMDYHLGWNKYSVANAVAAVAAQFPVVQITNPAGSNMIIKLEAIIMSATALEEYTINRVSPAAVNLATATTGNPRDTRQVAGTGAASQGVVSFATTATAFASGGDVDELQTANTAINLIPPGNPYILTANNTLIVKGSIANQLVLFTFLWRERMLNDQEGSR